MLTACSVHLPGGRIDFALPNIGPRLRRVFAVLLVLYAFELAARNIAAVPIDLLVWAPARSDAYRFWQPLTRYLVQGNDVVQVLLSCLVLYFAPNCFAVIFSI